MINRVLMALSNRRTFHEAQFVAAADFSPLRYSTAVTRIRRLLELDNTETDFYLKAYLAVLESHPDVLTGLDGERTYSAKKFSFRVVKPQGAELDPVANIPGLFDGKRPVTFPVPLNYVFTYADAEFVTGEIIETGQSAKMRYTAYTDGIAIAFNPDFPFSGLFRLTQPWTVNSQIRIYAEPGNFPWDLFIQKVNQSADAVHLLNITGSLNAYSVSHDNTEKAAIVLQAIARANTDIFSD